MKNNRIFRVGAVLFLLLCLAGVARGKGAVWGTVGNDYSRRVREQPSVVATLQGAEEEKNLAGALEYLKKQFTSCAEVDLSEFNITGRDLVNLLNYLQYQPEYFTVYSITVEEKDLDSKIGSFQIDYRMEKADYDEQMEFCKQEAEKILAPIRGKTYTNLQKIIYIHDYLCLNYSYEDLQETSEDPDIHQMYYFLKNRRGVCEAYAKTFEYLLKMLEIPVTTARGFGSPKVENNQKREGHIWNAVKLNKDDDNWYFLDCTWDASQYFGPGMVGRDSFLKSAAGFQPENTDPSNIIPSHKVYFENDFAFGEEIAYDLETGNIRTEIPYNDTAYDSYFWNSTNSPIVELDGQWYTVNTLDNEESYQLCLWDGDSGELLPVCDVRDLETGAQEITPLDDNPFSGLFVLDGYLYLNIANTLVAYKPGTGQFPNVGTFTILPILPEFQVDDSKIGHYQLLFGLTHTENVFFYEAWDVTMLPDEEHKYVDEEGYTITPYLPSGEPKTTKTFAQVHRLGDHLFTYADSQPNGTLTQLRIFRTAAEDLPVLSLLNKQGRPVGIRSMDKTEILSLDGIQSVKVFLLDGATLKPLQKSVLLQQP